ncbi:hypothetical protein [Mesorhizobium sp. LNJC394B00]|uniref:hypothetical protein n=1 Tax=unclassified Mesorhizobium TaxID=325217 RepID=UPI0003CF8504|nr:hypothetical protein [Mesorhizobium sp. LNJC394B00]ESY24311.1 hypothetical protein X750_09360 [Mesorhizobium sp. LNJC394B00]
MTANNIDTYGGVEATVSPSTDDERTAPTVEGPDVGSTAANFGSTEKDDGDGVLDSAGSSRALVVSDGGTDGPADALCSSSPLAAAIARCVHWNEGNGLFGIAWKDKVNEGLVPALTLALRLKEEGKEAVEQVLREPYFKNTKGNTQKDKVFVIAVRLTFKPTEPSHMKLCYEYAAIIQCAEQLEIPLADFASWVANTSIATCKAKLAKIKRESSQNDVGGVNAPATDTHPPNVVNVPEDVSASKMAIAVANKAEWQAIIETADPSALKGALVQTIADYKGDDVAGLLNALRERLAAFPQASAQASNQ